MISAETVPSTRRAILAGPALLPAIFAPDRWVAHPDRELIRLSERLTALWSAEATYMNSSEEAYAAYFREAEKLCDPLCAGRATTMDGLRAKARVAAWANGDVLDRWLIGDGYEHTVAERAAVSILSDLLRPA